MWLSFTTQLIIIISVHLITKELIFASKMLTYPLLSLFKTYATLVGFKIIYLCVGWGGVGG